MRSFSFSSNLSSPAEEILSSLTMTGVNTELSPLVRMTAPSSFATRSIFEWPERQMLFKSWILLFGILPIDRHTFLFERIQAGVGFTERSTSWTNRYWCHERKVVSLGSACQVVDTVTFQSRIPLLDLLLLPVYRLAFWRRHQYLQGRYGAGRSQ